MNIERAIEHLLQLHARAEERMRKADARHAQAEVRHAQAEARHAQAEARMDRHDAQIAALIRVSAHNNNQITGLLASVRALAQDHRVARQEMRELRRIFADWIRRSRNGFRPR